MVIFLFIQLADYYFSWKLAQLKLLYHATLLGVSFQSGFPYFNSLQSLCFLKPCVCVCVGGGGLGSFYLWIPA